MKKIMIGIALISLLGDISYAAPVVYTDEALFLERVAELKYSIIHESFENDILWSSSRNSISSPGSTPTVTSQEIVWTSNYPQNNIATGTVGGSAPDGAFAIYSLPHGLTTDSDSSCNSAEDPNIPIQCYQNDGLRFESATGDTLYGLGVKIDTSTIGKVTFLLDGVDINGNNPDNIDNWMREGSPVDNWSFVGVIDVDGFLSAELRELKGKDLQQVLLFADDFQIAVSFLRGDFNYDKRVDLMDAILGLQITVGIDLKPEHVNETDVNKDGRIGMADVVYILQKISGFR